MSKKSQIIILLGPPGAGKGTQAILLAEKFDLFYFETSKILEKAFEENIEEKIEIEGKYYSISEEKEKWKKGLLCSPPFVTWLVKKEIERLAKEGKGIVFSGSPRTLYEAERIMPLLEKLYGKENIKTILIDIPFEVSLFRNSHRRICQLLRHPILWTKETENLTICPLDGSKLIKRKGLDDPETIKVRWEEYKKRTFPIVEYLKKNSFKVEKVNGEGTVAEVFSSILKILEG